MDNFLVAKQSGLRTAWHSPTYDAVNPVISPTEAWEISPTPYYGGFASAFSGGAFYNPVEKCAPAPSLSSPLPSPLISPPRAHVGTNMNAGVDDRRPIYLALQCRRYELFYKCGSYFCVAWSAGVLPLSQSLFHHPPSDHLKLQTTASAAPPPANCRCPVCAPHNTSRAVFSEEVK